MSINILDEKCKKAIKALETSGYAVDYSYDPVYVRTVYITHPEKEVIGQELRGILGDTLTSLGMRLTPFEGGKIIDFYERGEPTESVKTPAKHWLIVAIFRHLNGIGYCQKNADIYKNGAINCNNNGLEKIAVKLERLNVRFSERASNHRECAAVLTLLISPPLFYNALDLKNGGKVDRFVEAES